MVLQEDRKLCSSVKSEKQEKIAIISTMEIGPRLAS